MHTTLIALFELLKERFPKKKNSCRQTSKYRNKQKKNNKQLKTYGEGVCVRVYFHACIVFGENGNVCTLAHLIIYIFIFIYIFYNGIVEEVFKFSSEFAPLFVASHVLENWNVCMDTRVYICAPVYQKERTRRYFYTCVYV